MAFCSSVLLHFHRRKPPAVGVNYRYFLIIKEVIFQGRLHWEYEWTCQYSHLWILWCSLPWKFRPRLSSVSVKVCKTFPQNPERFLRLPLGVWAEIICLYLSCSPVIKSIRNSETVAAQLYWSPIYELCKFLETSKTPKSSQFKVISRWTIFALSFSPQRKPNLLDINNRYCR